MAFRYLIYRTDFGNTIVRESAIDNPDNGQNEASFYTDFIIPEIQPLYLWRINDALSDVEPNTDKNINDWMDYTSPPPEPEDDATVGFVTGLTALKIDKVTGATGNVGIFLSDGNLEDSGYSIDDITGATSGDFVTHVEFTGYTATTDTRLDNIEDDIIDVETDIIYISGITDTKLDNSDFTGYTATTEIRLTDIESDVTDLSGATENKIDKVTGATDNLGVFLSNGNLKDSGFKIADLTGGTGGGGGIYSSSYILISGTSDSQPGAGNIKFNNVDPNNTTIIFIDNVDSDGNNVGNFYAALKDGDFFVIQNELSNNDAYIYLIAADSTQEVGYVKMYVQPFIINGGINYNTDVYAGVQYETNGSGDFITRGEFTGYTATTEIRLTDIESDVTYISGITDTKLDKSDFTGYTATTETRFNDIENDITYISGETANKLNRNEFVSYTATTETRLTGIEGDITDLENDKLDKTDFNQYTGVTDTRLDDIESDILEISGVTENAITGGTNGITKDGRNLKLGGGLTESTTITGNTNLEFNVDNLKLKGSTNVLIETDNDVDLKSVDNSGNTIFNININQTGGVITDNSSNQQGLKYNSNYNTTFDTRSLIDKGYADAIASGLDAKPSVRVATTGETVDISGGTFGGVVDNYTILDGDRVLIKDQSNAVENGVYVYQNSTNDFVRPVDFDNPNVTPGAFVFVETGSTNAGTGWVLLESTLVSAYDINVGSDPMYFTKFSSIAEYSAGHGININVHEILVDGAALDGDSILWSGDTFNVDLSSGKLKDALDEKLDKNDFDTYSGNTDTRLGNIEQDITDLETKVDNQYDVFTGYTASTQSNELFLIHSGGTNMNVTSGVAISWDSAQIQGSDYSWSNENITILKTGTYEINYNIPYIQTNNDRDIGIGSNIVLTRGSDTIVLDITSAAQFTSREDVPSNLVISSVVVDLQVNDVIKLVAFRTARNGGAETSNGGSIFIKEKNTLQ